MFFLLVFSHLLISIVFSAIVEKDRRLEYFELNRNWQPIADASVALFYKDKLMKKEKSFTLTNTSSYKSYYQTCAGVPYSEQPVPSECSGFLVDTDRIATAGHCVRNKAECKNLHFVFGFQSDRKNGVRTIFEPEKVFSCKKLIYTSQDPDLAVIQLDRPVKEITPLTLSNSTEIDGETSVSLAGFPHGLPFKLHPNGLVEKENVYANEKYFEAKLTCFKGNSGGPVINEKTLEVEGIFTVGFAEWDKEKDPATGETCFRPAVRSIADSVAGWIVKISYLKKILTR